MSNVFNTTTRLTSPEPTGFEKYLQDAWDEKRQQQVKTFMTYDIDTAIDNFQFAIANSLPLYKTRTPDADGKIPLLIVYGSYNLIDGDADTPKVSTFLKRLGASSKCPITKLLKKNKMVLIKRGCRTTGTILYEDGSIDVCDPVAGMRIDTEREFKGIQPIHTFYAVIGHM